IATFSLDNFRIANTRSLHKDTVYVSIGITVGANPPVIQTRAMGDLNNGTYQTGLSVAADIPSDNTPVAVNYVIVNNGHSGKDVVERALQTAVSALGDEAVKVASGATKGGTESAILGAALGIAPVPLVGTAIAVLSAWVVGKIGTLLFADCDGTVAAGIRIY